MTKILFLGLMVFMMFPNCHSQIIEVGEYAEIKDIKTAISMARAHDTVLVRAGHYKEHTLIIDKPLKLIGEGKPVIDAENEKNELIIIAADSVVVEGFVLSNVGVSYLKELSAIKVKRSKYGIVRNNEIKACFFGIYLEYASNFIIENNRVIGESTDEAAAGNAIHVWKGNHIEISNNVATGHRDGIYFEFVDDSNIHNNQSHGNIRYGLHFMFSNNDKYHQNTFSDNGAGVAVMFSKQIIMTNNRFTHNWGGASYGLLLKEISDGQISNNTFERNTVGVLAEGANRLLMSENKFILNGTALDIKGNCLDNKILKNNFTANTFEVVTNTKQNKNEYDHNYWSGYAGYDLDRDGIGDEPYRPVSLYAKITGEIPAATLLLHSFVVNLIEFTERIIPQIIPSELTDEHPKMKPYNYD